MFCTFGLIGTKFIENLPVVTNASFYLSCVLLTQMILEKMKKNQITLREHDKDKK